MNNIGNEVVNKLNSSEIKRATIGTVSGFVGWSADEYSPQEDYQLNTALFFALPILHSSIVVRSNYSLGAPFSFQDEENVFSAEEKYMNGFARRIRLKELLVPLSIHLDTYGTAYWYLNTNDNGEIIEITRVQPERVKVRLDEFGKISKFLVTLPNYKEKTSSKTVEIDPEYMIQFKERDWTEYPFGTSIIEPITDLCVARLDMNKITTAIYKSYIKPYRHLIYTPNEDDADGQIKNVILGMQDDLEEAEPDSDLITTNAWGSSSISSAGSKDETKFLEDVDKQILFQMAIPRFFYDPVGTTDLNTNKLDRAFLKNMCNRQEYIAQVIFERITIPQLDLIFPETNNIPLMTFENDYDEPERRKELIEEFKERIIKINEVRKGLGHGELEEDDELMKKEVEIAVLKTRYKKENLDIYEKWQNGTISDKEFLSKVKR